MARAVRHAKVLADEHGHPLARPERAVKTVRLGSAPQQGAQLPPAGTRQPPGRVGSRTAVQCAGTACLPCPLEPATHTRRVDLQQIGDGALAPTLLGEFPGLQTARFPRRERNGFHLRSIYARSSEKLASSMSRSVAICLRTPLGCERSGSGTNAGRSSRATSKGKKNSGLDHFEGRSWRGFHRRAVLVMLVFGFLALEARSAARLPPTAKRFRHCPTSHKIRCCQVNR